LITTTSVVFQGGTMVLLHITAEAEGAENEADVSKLDISTLTGLGTNPVMTPTGITLVKACWSTTFNSVRVEWDKTTTDETMVLCVGDGERDFECAGGKHATSAAGTNDVLVTTDGGADGSAYDILLLLKLEY